MNGNSLVRTLIILPLIMMTACPLCLAPVWAYAAEPDVQYDEATAQKLLALQSLLDQMDERIRTKILIPHAPFLVGTWKEMKPRLLYEIVREAGPDVKALEGEMKRAIELGREIERALKASDSGRGGERAVKP